MNVSAVIVTYNAGDELQGCLESLEGQDGLIETIVVDNGSSDDSVETNRARFPHVTFVELGRNLGYTGAANRGAERASGELILFLNADTRLAPDALSLLRPEFADAGVGVVGPRIELSKTDDPEFGYTIDALGSTVALTKPAPPLFHSGCAMLTSADLFRRLEGFDERFFMFADDVDFCLRAFVSGFDVRVVPEAVAWHYGGSATPGGYLTHEGISTTRFRLVLRERNTLAMLLKCYRGPLLAVAVPLYLAQTIATAAALTASGSRQAAREVLGGLVWNVRELPETMALRRRVQRSRRRSDRELLRRMYRGWHKGAVLLRHGLPTVDERRSVPAVASERRTAARS